MSLAISTPAHHHRHVASAQATSGAATPDATAPSTGAASATEPQSGSTPIDTTASSALSGFLVILSHIQTGGSTDAGGEGSSPTPDPVRSPFAGSPPDGSKSEPMTLVASATTAGAGATTATTASGSANSGGSLSSELTQLQSLLTTLTQNLAAASVGTGAGSETTSSLLPPPPPPTGSSAAAAPTTSPSTA